MLSSLLSPTRVLSHESMTPGDFAKSAYYLGKAPGSVTVVVDGRADPARDALIEGLARRFPTTVLDRVTPDPLCSDIDAMLREDGVAGSGLVIGIGGGSVLDSAKAIAALAPVVASIAAGASGSVSGEKPRLADYLGPNPTRKLEAKGAPLLLVPTTAGTGAEVTKVGVFRDGSGRKHTLGSPFLQADAAILIGTLAATMPPALAAATGFDALDHALESLWNKNATPVTIAAAADAAVAVLSRIEASYAAAREVAGGGTPDPAAALAMLQASTMAGFAFSMTGTAIGHALSFILTEEWRTPHGVACAFTIEDCFRRALADREIRDRLAAVAARLSAAETAPETLLDRILRLKRDMRLPFTFADLGISLTKDRIRPLFERAFDDPKMANTRPAVGKEEVYAMLENKLC